MERLGVLEARGFCKACGTPNIDEAEFEALIRLARAGIDRLTTAKSGVGITDEMVEAGAIALYELERLGGPWKREMPPEVADARRRMWNELCDEDHRCYTEAEITVSGKNGYRQFARSALTAAIGKMGQ